MSQVKNEEEQKIIWLTTVFSEYKEEEQMK